MAKYLLLTFIIVSSFKSFSQTTLNYRVANWLDNKKAAVSITFDDNCDGQFTHALPAMNSRNIRSTYFVVSGPDGCTGLPNWNDIQDASTAGHEIAAHTVNHYDLSTLDTTQIKYQMQASRDTIDAHITNQKVLTFAYPFGSGGGSAASEDKVRLLAERYFISARGAGVNTPQYVEYEEYTNPLYENFNYQIESFEINDTVDISEYTAIVDAAITNSGWFIPQYHGIETGGFGNITSVSFNQQLDALVSRQSNIWIAPYVDVFKYHYEKRNATLAEVSEDNSKWVLRLTDALPDTTYKQALTLRIHKPNAFSVTSVKQGTASIPFTVTGDTLQVNAVPDGGDITITKGPGTAIAETNPLSNIKLYPNPATQEFFVDGAFDKLEVYNLLGQQVFERTGNSKEPIRISVNKGSYLVRVSNGDEFVVKKLIVN